MSGSQLTLSQWVRSAPAEDFWFWGVALIVVALVGFFLAFYYLHRKRVMQDIPTSKIRSAAQGYLELDGYGQLMEGQPIISPLSGQTCTWYRFQVDEKRKRGKNTEWATIRKGVSDELFLIKDETGECVIDPEGAHVTVSEKMVWYGNEPSPRGRPLAGKSRIWQHVIGSGINRYRYTEHCLHIGEPLYAIGLFKTIGGSGTKLDVNEDMREVIREWKADTESLLKRFDTNKDGEIDMEEWQQVREEAYKHVLEKHNEYKNHPPVHMMSRTRDKRRPYILSALPQDDLMRRFHWLSLLFFSAFLSSGGFAAWIISLRLAT